MIPINLASYSFYLSRYDSITDSSRNDMKRKFALTMEFVEEYLKEVVNQPFPFGDKEKNKLTFEVFHTNNSFVRLFSFPCQKLDILSTKVFFQSNI